MKFKFIPLLIGVLLLGSCSSTPPSSITGVAIAGERSLKVGQTTTLVADVLGTDDDSVTWSSNNNSIATVSNEGVVAAVSEGNVSITATSKVDPTYSNSISINVYYPNIQSVKIVVEEIEGLEYDELKDVYNVPLGRAFLLSYKITNPTYYKAPTHINYKLTLPSDIPSDNVFTLDYTDDENTRIIHTYDSIENAIITLELGYENTEIPYIYDVAVFNVTDINASNKQALFNDFDALKSFEQDNVNEITIERSKSYVSEGKNVVESSLYVGNVYNASSYSRIQSTKSLDGTISEEDYSYYHHSISNNYYLAFEVDENSNILSLFSNTSIHSKPELANNIKFAPLFYEGDLKLGVNEIFYSYFNADYAYIADDIATFADTSLYAYATFYSEENSKTILSSYVDEETGVNYAVELTFLYTNEIISSSSFSASVSLGDEQITFEEHILLQQGARVDDDITTNPYYIDTNDYYYTSFEVQDFHGKKENPQGGYIYDYTNDEKYGVDNISTEDGLTKYTLTYDKTLIIKIKSPAPSTANSLIDKIVAVSSDESQIKSVETVGEDIFAINPINNSDGLAQTGKATFTFTSRMGATYKIIVEFVAKELQEIIVSNIDNPNMGEIYQHRFTPYFYLNAVPDEDKYEFGINILSGPENGLTLNRWSYDNEFGYPGFSYYIQGELVGEYTFKFYAQEGSALVQSEETYSLVVLTPKTVNELEALIVSETYKYATQNNTHVVTMTFDTNSLITLTSEMAGSSKVSTTINYHFETGKVIIDETSANTLGPGFYWSKINANEIIFDNTYENMSVKFTDPASEDSTTLNSYYVHFKIVVSGEDIGDVEEYINGKTFTNPSTTFITTLYQTNISVSFNDGTGELTLTPTNTSITPVTFTFNYTYVSGTNVSELALTNISINNSSFTINSSADVDLENGNITFVIFVNEIRYSLAISII